MQDIEQAKLEEKQVLEEVSKRLGVPADWLSVREQVYCVLLHRGMTQDEVEKVLLNIAPFNMRLYREHKQVYFSDTYVARALSPLIFFFDKNSLLEGLSAGEHNFGPRASCEYSH
jgi:hypothetical protein